MTGVVRTAAAAAFGTAAAVTAMWLLLQPGRPRRAELPGYTDVPDVAPRHGIAGVVHRLPAPDGLQLLTGEDLDHVVSHMVACGAANALATAEPGGWASTTARLDEIADSVADARITAAMKWLDDHRIELVRRHR